MSEIISLVEQVDVKIEKVKTEKGKAKQEIEATLGDIDSRLDEQMKVKVHKLIGQYNSVYYPRICLYISVQLVISTVL